MSLLDRMSSSQVITVGLTVFHGVSAALTVHRPNMVEIVGVYGAFHDVMPTTSWGLWMALTAIILLLAPKGSFIRLLGQFFSVSILAIFSVLVSAVVGINWGTIAYAFLAWGSLLVMGETAGEWFDRRRWYRRMVAKRHG